MYKNGAGYSERRQIMSQSLSSRTYDTMKGIKINVVQVCIFDAFIVFGSRLTRLTSLEQTGTILIPDVVTTILNLMTGMGLLGVAAVVSTAASYFAARLRVSRRELQIVSVLVESVLPIIQSRCGSVSTCFTLSKLPSAYH